MQKPAPYGFSPMPEMKGSLEPFKDSIVKNFNLAEASIRQIIAYLLDVESRVPGDWQARVYAVEKVIAGIGRVVSLTGAGGGSTWNMADLDGYPNIRAVVIDPNGEANTLNLPVLGSSDKSVITVKCLSNSGTLSINAGAANIVSASGGTPTLSIPYGFVADGVALTTYAVTLAWTGSDWQVIDTAILVA
jgi:hypothetical protein